MTEPSNEQPIEQKVEQKIERLFAWVVTEHGAETLMMLTIGNFPFPAIYPTRDGAEMVRDGIRTLQRTHNVPIRLVCFEKRIEIERLGDA